MRRSKGTRRENHKLNVESAERNSVELRQRSLDRIKHSIEFAIIDTIAEIEDEEGVHILRRLAGRAGFTRRSWRIVLCNDPYRGGVSDCHGAVGHRNRHSKLAQIL